MSRRKQVITEPLDDQAKAEVFSAEKGAAPPETFLNDFVALFIARNRIAGRYEMPHMVRARLIAAAVLSAVFAAAYFVYRQQQGYWYLCGAAAAAALLIYVLFVRRFCSMQRYLTKEILRRPDEDIDVWLFDTLSVSIKCAVLRAVCLLAPFCVLLVCVLCFGPKGAVG